MGTRTTPSARPPALLGAAALLALAGCALGDRERAAPPPNANATERLAQPQPRRIAWAGNGLWLEGDLHAHTSASYDGSVDVESLVELAAKECDFFAVTDHGGPLKAGGRGPDTATERAYQAYLDAVAAQGDDDLLAFYGVEWNFSNVHHAGVLLPPRSDTREILEKFVNRFDATRGEIREPVHALDWLDRETDGQAVVTINHPSRARRENPWVVPLDLIAEWSAESPLFVAVEAAPGHQRRFQVGRYEFLPTIHGFDPIVQVVGGGWDALLHQGFDVGVVAGSDYHSDDQDHAPCTFTRLLLNVPERTHAGVLAALRARAAVVVLGGSVRSVDLSVAGPGLDPPARIGETVVVPAGSDLAVRIELDVSPTDHRGHANSIRRLDLIGDVDGIVGIYESWENPQGRLVQPLMKVRDHNDGRGFYLRVRGRSRDGAWFVTDAVRILPR